MQCGSDHGAIIITNMMKELNIIDTDHLNDYFFEKIFAS